LFTIQHFGFYTQYYFNVLFALFAIKLFIAVKVIRPLQDLKKQLMREVGVGSRVINFVVDTILIALIAYGLFKWNNFYVYYWHHKYYPFYLFFYPIIFIYYTIFEATTARSPGKWLSITKVQNKEGQRPAFYQILLRSLLRLTFIDMFFIPVFDRPLHDQLSKTRVVEA